MNINKTIFTIIAVILTIILWVAHIWATSQTLNFGMGVSDGIMWAFFLYGLFLLALPTVLIMAVHKCSSTFTLGMIWFIVLFIYAIYPIEIVVDKCDNDRYSMHYDALFEQVKDTTTTWNDLIPNATEVAVREGGITWVWIQEWCFTQGRFDLLKSAIDAGFPPAYPSVAHYLECYYHGNNSRPSAAPTVRFMLDNGLPTDSPAIGFTAVKYARDYGDTTTVNLLEQYHQNKSITCCRIRDSLSYQKIINTRNIITKNEEIIPPKPPKIDSILKIQHSNQQLQPRTTPARDIIIEVFDTIPTNTEIYYYSPRMESENYSYRKELGSDNNFLDVTDIYNRTAITVPDTCEQGAKLLFRAQGYEPLDLPMNEVYGKSHITIQLIPKIYNSTAVLEEIIFRDTISIIEIINLHETPAKVFYGQCLPIYSEDGINHSDPYCAFACMGCYPEFNVAKEYYSGELDELKKLHQFLKKGGDCALVISVDKRQIRDIEIEGCSNKALDNIRKSMLTTPQGSYQGTYDGYRFQYRINFAAP